MVNDVTKRDSRRTAILRLCKKLPDYIAEGSSHRLQAVLSTLTTYWDEFNAHQVLVEAVSGSATIDEQRDIMSGTEDVYLDALTELQSAISAQSPPPVERVNSNSRPVVVVNESLPRLDIPKFHSTFESWPAFSDLFTSIVRNNTRLSDAQKLQHLKLNVTGEAEALIRHFHTTDANFRAAWTALTNRFDNRRLIVHSHLKRLFNQPVIVNESSSALRNLLDTTDECIASLNLLEVPTDNWDPFLIYYLSQKLDNETRRHWEFSQTGTDLQTYSDLRTFVENRFRALEASTSGNPKRHSVSNATTQRVKMHTATIQRTVDNTSRQATCRQCNGDHSLGQCRNYLSLSTDERSRIIRDHNLCFNCLRTGHSSRNCHSKSRCLKCNRRHHTTIHPDDVITPSSLSSVPSTSTVTANNGDPNARQLQLTNAMTTRVVSTRVLLSTAVILVVDAKGNRHRVRALLDNGAQASFISQSLCKRLSLKGNSATLSILGLGGSQAGTSSHRYQIEIQPRPPLTTIKSIVAEVYAIDHITSISSSVSVGTCNEFMNLELADPYFNTTSNIDILLGADVYGSLLLPGLIQTSSGLTAQNTLLGWIISGRIHHQTDHSATTSEAGAFHIVAQDQSIDQILRTFWEIEECPTVAKATQEQELCERHFSATHFRTEEGRYVVRLPFRSQNDDIVGNSRNGALMRLYQMERRFTRNPDLRHTYCQFMSEYLALGHMTETALPTNLEQGCFYLPHHAVIGASGKIRVVFDGSRKSRANIALNDLLIPGPTIQPDLVTIILQWRRHKFVFSADIVKMYRQVLVHIEDTNYQRIVWRVNPSEEIKDYRLTTVTYGTNCAPFLAVRALQQLAIDGRQQHERAAQIIESDFYVDDIMSGCNELKSAIDLRDELIALLKLGGFTLGKWASNHPELLAHIPNEQRRIDDSKEINANEIHKTLGILWQPHSDMFTFSEHLRFHLNIATKRSLLSDIGKIFDPLGWLAPIVVIAKCMFQKLWLLPVSWDDELPPEIIAEWNEFRSQLPMIREIKLSRWIGYSPSCTVTLHGFCDASTAAYAAVVYCSVSDGEGKTTTQLLMSKSRVAPVKQLSIPRLELCGASLLARLMTKVSEALGCPISDKTYWTDSTIVLAWIGGHASRWQTFVANRVSEIQTITIPSQWRHVPSHLNSADCASRGMLPKELTQHQLWWHGPEFLSMSRDVWPPTKCGPLPEIECRKSSPIVQLHLAGGDSGPITQLVDKYSSISRLRRVVAHILRFARNCRRTSESRASGPLTTSELANSLTTCIRMSQLFEYSNEIRQAKADQPISKGSKLAPLHPFIDNSDILRVGGRIQRSALNHRNKHQIILPRNSHLTTLITREIHQATLHGGVQLILATLRSKYWIVGARQYIRKVVHQCVTCAKLRKATQQQIMASLPVDRITPARPFLKSGVDFAGPITMKSYKGRCNRLVKGYIAVFVCFPTRAIHLELVADLTTDAFVAAFRRFTARRGHCTDLFCDNGRNFVGAEKELGGVVRGIEQHVSSAATSGTQMHFNPPGAPHFGGLWEAGVKSVKHHLHRTMGNTHLTYEELNTLLHQIEACLNSRPLCPMSDDPDDYEILTPGHFLIGQAMIEQNEPNLLDTPLTKLSRWQSIQHLKQQFWQRWSAEYLTQLQNRPKWRTPVSNMTIGDLVILHEPLTEPKQWQLGRIAAVHPGPDAKVRVVTIKTRQGTFKRPVHKLSLLPSELKRGLQGGRDVE